MMNAIAQNSEARLIISLNNSVHFKLRKTDGRISSLYGSQLNTYYLILSIGEEKPPKKLGKNY